MKVYCVMLMVVYFRYEQQWFWNKIPFMRLRTQLSSSTIKSLIGLLSANIANCISSIIRALYVQLYYKN